MASDDTAGDDVITRKMLLHLTGEFDIESIHTLNLDHSKITNIDALEECTSLDRLNLSFNKITFLNSLKALTSITFLNLSSNNITNIDHLKNLETLEELNLAGNYLSSIDRLKCLCGISTLQKLRLENRTENLSNPLCQKEGYQSTVLNMLPDLLTLNGHRMRGRGSELYKMCCELDKQLETFEQEHGQKCPCDSCLSENSGNTAGRSFGPVPERPMPGPWLKPGHFTYPEESTQSKAIVEFEKVLQECKDLDQAVGNKIESYRQK